MILSIVILTLLSRKMERKSIFTMRGGYELVVVVLGRRPSVIQIDHVLQKVSRKRIQGINTIRI